MLDMCGRCAERPETTIRRRRRISGFHSCLIFAWTIIACLAVAGCQTGEPKLQREKQNTRPSEATRRMIQASESRLRPAYAPLAQYISEQLQLGEAEGVGIDLGSGPGTLIVELAKRTRHHWINADINPQFFAYFYNLAEKNNLTGRVSAIMADAQHLPFHDNYADVIVSRGSYRFWEDKQAAFREIYRVLKPGGVAFVGRGFSPNLPIDTAMKIRKAQGKSMDYSFAQKAAELRTIMRNLGITDFRIHDPSPEHGRKINYGIWIELRK